MKKLLTSILALAFGFTPALALAEESSTGATVDVSVQVEGSTGTTKEPSRPPKEPIRPMKGQVPARPATMQKEDRQTMEMRVHAAKAVEMRMENLDKLSARIDKLDHLPADVKASLRAHLDGERKGLNSFKGEFGENASTTNIKARLEAFAKAEHSISVVARQGALIAAANRVLAVGAKIEAIAAKLSARIDVAVTAGADMGTSVTALADIRAKIASSTALAQSAITIAQGVSTTGTTTADMKASLAVFKDAHAKIVDAQKALIGVRKDAGTIVKALHEYNKSTHSTTTVQATTTTP